MQRHPQPVFCYFRDKLRHADQYAGCRQQIFYFFIKYRMNVDSAVPGDNGRIIFKRLPDIKKKINKKKDIKNKSAQSVISYLQPFFIKY